MAYRMGSLLLLQNYEDNHVYSDSHHILDSANEIITNLWVGSYPQENEAKSYDRIFCVTSNGFGPFGDDETIVVRCPMQDEARMPPIKTLDVLSDMVLESVKAGNKTLVHCSAGVNRSVLIVVLALVKQGMEPIDAINLVRQKRGNEMQQVLTNQTFFAWILENAKSLRHA